jgi:hypothetical protein
MESLAHLRKGNTPRRLHAGLDGLKDDELGRLFEAIDHPDKEMFEIRGATHYYAGPDQRDKLRQAVDIVSDWLTRHDFARTK